jgi:hypothetical protein
VQGFFDLRRLAALICLALLLFSSVAAPAAAHLDLALPVLIFCFLVVSRPSRLRPLRDVPAVQAISLLSLHISRAPPQA